MRPQIIFKDPVGIYFPNDPLNLPPRFTVFRNAVRIWRDEGYGAYVNKAKGFQLNFTPTETPEVRGKSCRMTLATIIAFCEGRRWASEVAEVWA